MINYHVSPSRLPEVASCQLLKEILQECFDLSLLLLFPKFLVPGLHGLSQKVSG